MFNSVNILSLCAPIFLSIKQSDLGKGLALSNVVFIYSVCLLSFSRSLHVPVSTALPTMTLMSACVCTLAFHHLYLPCLHLLAHDLVMLLLHASLIFHAHILFERRAIRYRLKMHTRCISLLPGRFACQSTRQRQLLVVMWLLP